MVRSAPIFLGLVIVFSQLEQADEVKQLSAVEIADSIASKISKSEKLLELLRQELRGSMQKEFSAFKK